MGFVLEFICPCKVNMTWVHLNLLKGKSHWGSHYSLRLLLFFEEDFEIKINNKASHQVHGTFRWNCLPWHDYWHLNDTVEFVPSIWLSGSVWCVFHGKFRWNCLPWKIYYYFPLRMCFLVYFTHIWHNFLH